MCRDILNSCVRNTEEAEKNSRSSDGTSVGGSGRGGGVDTPGRLGVPAIRRGRGRTAMTPPLAA